MEYIAIIHKDEGSDYGVSFPDFPGCITAGHTLEEARTLAAEALALHIKGMSEDGEDIPAPSDLDQIMTAPDFRDGVAFLVKAAAPARTIRINITLREDHLADIDRAARAAGLTRSAYLAAAALERDRENRA
jgi:predicted RNase H-like HicB family nuclease